MGYTKLTYEEYIDNIDYWKFSKGVELPNYAEYLSELGFSGVCACDFYDDIFRDDLEPHREKEDYREGEYGGIVLSIKAIKDKQGKVIDKRTKRRTFTQDLNNLLDAIDDDTDDFVLTSPISYAGKARTNKNARYLYALCIEIDNIKGKSGIDELIYTFNRPSNCTTIPTYIVCSGNGLHLYWVFENPIPLYANMFETLTEAKNWMVKQLWDSHTTWMKDDKDRQYESLNQPFRCVGSRTKKNSYAMAFLIGEHTTIEKLNKVLPQDKQIEVCYKSKCTLVEAKEKYPQWYQRRIIEGKGKGHFIRQEGIYYNWIEKIKEGAEVSHRYFCLENLCSLAVQCNISPEQVTKDCYELMDVLEERTVREDNHFTEYDVICALKTYYLADEGAYTRKIEYISRKTGIPLTRSKRNGRKQADHIRLMNFVRDEINKNTNWRDGNGRPSKEKIIQDWRDEHPNGTPKDCINDTGISKNTVYRWWK